MTTCRVLGRGLGVAGGAQESTGCAGLATAKGRSNPKGTEKVGVLTMQPRGDSRPGIRLVYALRIAAATRRSKLPKKGTTA